MSANPIGPARLAQAYRQADQARDPPSDVPDGEDPQDVLEARGPAVTIDYETYRWPGDKARGMRFTYAGEDVTGWLLWLVDLAREWRRLEKVPDSEFSGEKASDLIRRIGVAVGAVLGAREVGFDDTPRFTQLYALIETLEWFDELASRATTDADVWVVHEAFDEVLRQAAVVFKPAPPRQVPARRAYRDADNRVTGTSDDVRIELRPGKWVWASDGAPA